LVVMTPILHEPDRNAAIAPLHHQGQQTDQQARITHFGDPHRVRLQVAH
jgi:hypothetical protein